MPDMTFRLQWQKQAGTEPVLSQGVGDNLLMITKLTVLDAMNFLEQFDGMLDMKDYQQHVVYTMTVNISHLNLVRNAS
jgi:hypothetical protein